MRVMLCLCTLISFSATTARAERAASPFVQDSAQQELPQDEQAHEPLVSVYVDQAIGGIVNPPGDGTAIGWAPTIGATARPFPWLQLDAQIPFTMVAIRDSSMSVDETRFRIGNPYLGAMYRMSMEGVSMSGGLGLTLPAAWIPDTNALSGTLDSIMAYNAYAFGAAMHGRLDYWLYAPEAMSIVMPVRASYRLPNTGFIARGGFVLGGAFSVGSASSHTGLFQFDIAPAYAFGRFEVGLRFAGAVQFNDDGSLTQTSLFPYFRMNFSSLYAQAGLLMNLDTPHSSFRDYGILAGQLLVGYDVN